MKTRIIAQYISKEGYDEIGDRDVDLDEYTEKKVQSVKEGASVITEKEKNGCGQVLEQAQREEGDDWDTIKETTIDSGKIVDVKIL